jgi:hypothetical protein
MFDALRGKAFQKTALVEPLHPTVSFPLAFAIHPKWARSINFSLFSAKI